MATEKEKLDIDYDHEKHMKIIKSDYKKAHSEKVQIQANAEKATLLSGTGYDQMAVSTKNNGLKVDCVGNLPGCEGYVETRTGFVETPGSTQVIDVRKVHKLQKELNQSGLEPCKKDIPELTTLAEKVAKGNSEQMLALAGMAMKQQKTVFDIFRKNIFELKRFASLMDSKAEEMSSQLKFLEELAVLNDIE